MRSGTIRLFRFAGIDVFLHFTWFIIAAYFISGYIRKYESPVWGVLEYVSLFAIVLIHEFGHALACRQVGGIANQIVLWPLGGVAFVNPPRRAGAYLWSIAAGPLVNVLLLPLLGVISMVVRASAPGSDMAIFFRDLYVINTVLLIFNLLPIFPLDGGQIVRGLLWFPLGEIRSLQIASVIGLVGGAILGIVGLMAGSVWWAILAFFLLSRAWYGWQQAKAMIAMSRMQIPIPTSPSTSENFPPPPQ